MIGTGGIYFGEGRKGVRVQIKCGPLVDCFHRGAVLLLAEDEIFKSLFFWFVFCFCLARSCFGQCSCDGLPAFFVHLILSLSRTREAPCVQPFAYTLMVG